MEKTLYLHWGPGGNTQAELNSFSHLFTSQFEWWNQPNSGNAPHPYAALIQATLTQISKIADKTQARVNLFGHSFGAQLALEAAKRIPEKIGRITLAAALPSVKAGYVHFGHQLAKIYHDEAIQKASENFEQKPSIEAFENFVAAVSQRPDFLIHYWGRSSHSIAARESFLKATETQPPLNFEVYMTVMKDVLNICDENYEKELTAPSTIPVDIHLGSEDPYLDINEAVKQWKLRIPHARISTHPAGHFVHLELGTVWT